LIKYLVFFNLSVKILAIKSLTPEQIPEIVALDQLCIGGIWTAEGYLREITSPNSSLLALYFLDRQQQQKETMIGMGCLWAIAEEAHITLLGIHPNYRRQGLGQLLLLTLLQRAIALELAWATLEVNIHNSGAINLYQKLGFQIMGKRKKYYQATGDDALVLWLKDLQKSNFQQKLAQYQQETDKRLRKHQYCLKNLQNC
jgi:[ribosomal protein S18]-alanine N-acetyltransferase